MLFSFVNRILFYYRISMSLFSDGIKLISTPSSDEEVHHQPAQLLHDAESVVWEIDLSDFAIPLSKKRDCTSSGIWM